VNNKCVLLLSKWATLNAAPYIRQQTGVEETIIKEIEQNQLTW